MPPSALLGALGLPAIATMPRNQLIILELSNLALGLDMSHWNIHLRDKRPQRAELDIS
jgi:hypothetical protein